MSIMPGAVWRPITIPGGNPGARTKGRGVVLHVAASEATSLFGFFNNNPNANSHFYVNKAGVIEQMIDTDLQAWASMAANRNTISVETQGGVTSPDTEPWTAAQVDALGQICAWANATEGIPLTLMPNSLPGSRGIGYHRLGINPWRVTGGEVWSSSTGKVCPGTAKIAQIPAVIQAAHSGGTDVATQIDMGAFLNYPAYSGGPSISQVLKDLHVWARGDLGRPTDSLSFIAQLIQGVQATLAGGTAVDAQAVADAILAKLSTPQAEQVAALVLAGLNGAKLSVGPAT